MSATKEWAFSADELAEKLGLPFDGYGTYTGWAALEEHFGSKRTAMDKVRDLRVSQGLSGYVEPRTE